MVLTPWGYSGTLKERKLRPGPGVPREEVVANQRERLFGAMVTSVCQRGYEATTLSDLVEISGVSSRTFYDLFPDKQAAFLATLEAIIQAAVAYAAQTAGQAIGEERPGGVKLPEGRNEEPASWQEQARWGYDAFTIPTGQAGGCSRPSLPIFSSGSGRRWRSPAAPASEAFCR